MRKTVSAVFLAVVMAFGVGNAYAATTTFDFESFADGTNITGVNIGGATITRGGDQVLVTDLVPGGASTRDIEGNPFTGNSYRADFSFANVSAVSVALGDFDADLDNLFLQAFDSSNTLLSSDAFTIPATFEGLHTLSVSSATDIAYVVFGSTGVFPNSVFADDLSVTFNSTSVVPLPGALPLFATGLVGLGLLSRRRKKAAA